MPENTRRAERARLKAQKKSKRDFEKTQAKAGPDQTVCATLGEDGQPIYFLAPKGASDRVVMEAAFLARHGRQMSRLERQMYDIATQRAARGS